MNVVLEIQLFIGFWFVFTLDQVNREKKLTEAKIRYRNHLAYTNLASQFIYSHRIVTVEEWVLLKDVVMNPRWGHRRISRLLKAKKELDKIKSAKEEPDA